MCHTCAADGAHVMGPSRSLSSVGEVWKCQHMAAAAATSKLHSHKQAARSHTAAAAASKLLASKHCIPGGLCNCLLFFNEEQS